MSCNGCRILRKGCSESCILRPCLQWIESPEAQSHATVFVAKFFGRAGLMSFISNVPSSHRPALFRSLLYEACGRTVNPVNGAVGLLATGIWHVCEAAVETVLKGGALHPIPELLNRISTSPEFFPDLVDEAASEVACPPNNNDSDNRAPTIHQDLDRFGSGSPEKSLRRRSSLSAASVELCLAPPQTRRTKVENGGGDMTMMMKRRGRSGIVEEKRRPATLPSRKSMEEEESGMTRESFDYSESRLLIDELPRKTMPLFQ